MSVIAQHTGVTYLSSRDAAKRVGYTSDYIARLAREGKIISRREGIQWFVELASLEMFLKAVEQAREERKAHLREERRKEREHFSTKHVVPQSPTPRLNEPQSHTVADVVDMRLLDDDAPVVVAGAGRAHATAAAVLAAGSLFAFVLVFSGSIAATAERNTASLVDSMIGMARTVRFLVMPWHREVAQAPVVESEYEHRGIVVLKPDATDATMREVQESFSDDVNVDVNQDGMSGTITPVFKDGPGDEYRFVIVPVAQPP